MCQMDWMVTFEFKLLWDNWNLDYYKLFFGGNSKKWCKFSYNYIKLPEYKMCQQRNWTENSSNQLTICFDGHTMSSCKVIRCLWWVIYHSYKCLTLPFYWFQWHFIPKKARKITMSLCNSTMTELTEPSWGIVNTVNRHHKCGNRQIPSSSTLSRVTWGLLPFSRLGYCAFSA